MEFLEIGDFIEILDNHFGDWGFKPGEAGKVVGIIDKSDFHYNVKWIKDGSIRKTGICCRVIIGS